MIHSDLNIDIDSESANSALPEVWVWELMPPAQRRHRLREVATWVTWLRSTYALNSKIPDCWYAHPLALQHLTALYVAWVDTYLSDQPHRALALIDWHEAMWRTVDRIHRHTPSTCLDSQHTQPHTPHRSADAADELTAFTTGPWGTAESRCLTTLHRVSEPMDAAGDVFEGTA